MKIIHPIAYVTLTACASHASTGSNGAESGHADHALSAVHSTTNEVSSSWEEHPRGARVSVSEFAEVLGVSSDELTQALEMIKKEGRELGTEGANLIEAVQEEGRSIGEGALDEARRARKDMQRVGDEGRRIIGEVREEGGIVMAGLADGAGGLLKEAAREAKSSWQTDGVFGMVAGALGCTRAELADVIQYFGKEAKEVYKDISELPEWRELLNRTSDIALGAGDFIKSGAEEALKNADNETRPALIQQAYPAPRGSRFAASGNDSVEEKDTADGGDGGVTEDAP